MQIDQFVEDLLSFTTISMEWCAKESENSATKVANAVSILMEDTERVAKMSKDSISAVNDLKHSLESWVDKTQTSSSSVMALITGLKSLCSEHHELHEVISPIIEALQFQDRLRQNMENQSQMFQVWIKLRKEVMQTGQFTDEMTKELGTKMLEHTTMREEREVIRKHIEGMDAEEEVDDVSFF